MKKTIILLFVSIPILVLSQGNSGNILTTQKDSLSLNTQNIKQILSKLEKLEKKIDSEAPKTIVASIGGNLDFLEKVKVNGVYFDIDFFIPELIGKSKQGFFKRIGLSGRLNQGRVISVDTLGTFNARYFSETGSDTLTQITSKIRNSSNNAASYFSCQFLPTIRLAGDQDSDSKLYFAYYTDLYRYQSKFSRNQEVISSDSISILKPSDFNPLTDTVSYKPVIYNISNTAYNWNNGIGFHYRYDTKYVSLYVTAIAGIGNVVSGNFQKNGFFYYSRVEAFENQLGFKVGVEIRSVVSIGKDPSIFYNSPIPSPNISFYFAKTLNFSNIKSLIAGG